MSSDKVKFLEKVASDGIAAAKAQFPNVLAAGEEELLKVLNADQLKKLIALRVAAESDKGIDAIHGSGYMSM